MCERLANPASVFPPCVAQPLTAGPNDDRDGEAEDDDDALAVPGFGSSASIVDTGGGGARWNSAETAGGAHGRVDLSTDDDDDMPGLVNGGCWFGGGSGLIANARGRQNRCRLPLRWIAKGRMASSKLMIRPIGGVVATVRVVEAPVSHGPQWNGQSGGRRGGCDLLLLVLLHPPTHLSIFFLPRPTICGKGESCTYCSFYSTAKI